MPIDISRAESIDGWMSPAELRWLATWARRSNTIVEVGCFIGRSTRVLADHTVGVVYAVDPWDARWQDTLAHDEPDAYEVAQRYPNPLSMFLGNMRDLTNVFIYRGTLEYFPLVRADMVFIDGDHSYEAVARDVDRALQLLTTPTRRRVGMLCGHDYGRERWPQVAKAVDEVAGLVQVVPNTSIWFREV